MEKRDQLTRTCSVCGLEKLLSAFLQITANQGTTYGTICAACRSKGAKERAAKTILEDEQTSSTQSGNRIGTKQRVEIEKEKKRLLQQEKKNDLEDRKKRTEIKIEKLERSEEQQKAEKANRAEFEAKQKQSYLNYQTKKNPLGPQATIGQKIEDRTFAATAQINEQKQATEETKKTDEAAKKEALVNKVDLSGTPHSDRANSQSLGFQAYLASLGPDAPIVKAAMSKLLAQKAAAAAAEKTAAAEKNKAAQKLSNQQTTFAKSLANEKKSAQENQSQKAESAQNTSQKFSNQQTTFAKSLSSEKKSTSQENQSQNTENAKNYINNTWRRR